MSRRSRVAAVVAVALAAALVGCSGDGGEPASVTGSGTLGPGATGSESPSPYLPVPPDVDLTPQGTHLEIGDSAVVAYEPRQNLVGVLDLTVTKIEETTTGATMARWQLTPAQQASTPYFVHVDARNAGDTELGGRPVPLYGLTDDDLLVEATPFTATFRPCPSTGLPTSFGPDATAQVCLVYLVPDHGRLKGVSFRPDETFDPIYWTGFTEPYVRPTKPTNPASPDRTATTPDASSGASSGGG